jgi:DedD protein
VAPPEPISEEPPPAAPAPGTEAAPAAIEPPAPAAKMAEARSTPPPALSGWVVQVGAFSANDVASREAAKLQDKGYPAFVFAEPPSTPGPRYKVRVGPYSARAEADRMLSTLTREGYKPLLKR